jgi:hypothetical protein
MSFGELFCRIIAQNPMPARFLMVRKTTGFDPGV